MSFFKHLYFLVDHNFYESESLFKNITFTTIISSLILAYVFYTILGKKVDKFATKQFWSIFMFINALVVGISTYWLIRSAYGGAHFDFNFRMIDLTLIGSSMFNSTVLFFLLSCVFKGRIFTVYCRHIPFK